MKNKELMLQMFAHTAQERYSSLVLAKLRKTSIFYSLANKSYEGTPTAGAVKIPVRDTEVEAKDYDKAKGGTLTTGTTTYQTLPIDKDIYVNELIDGYDAASVPDNIVADRLDSAGYSMGQKVDNSIITILTPETGTTASAGGTTALTKTNVYDTVIDDIQAMKKKGVNVSEMWLAVTNATYGLMLKCPEFIKASDLGDAVVQNGLVGKIGGVNVYETNQIEDTTKIEYILGNRIFCHFVDEWITNVSVSDLKDGVHIGASAVQGRRVFGATLSRASTVVVKKKA